MAAGAGSGISGGARRQPPPRSPPPRRSSRRLALLALVLASASAAAAPPLASAATASQRPAAAPPRFGSVIAPADTYSLPPAALPPLPLWVRNRSADVVLDFRKADPRFALDWRYRALAPAAGADPKKPVQPTAHVPFRGRDMPVLFPQGHFHGNVAVVRFGARLVAAVRKMYFFKTTRAQVEGYPPAPPDRKGHDALISWWGSSVAVCDLDPATLQPAACADFDPRPWGECTWGLGFEGTGVEDPRLIVWPGKGLFVMFGSKPWPVDPSASPVTAASAACDGPWAFQPWLMMLQPLAGARPDPSDPWQRGIVRLSYLAGGGGGADGAAAAAPPPPGGELLKEKNWNPFIYKGRLLFSQTFDPHVVLEPYPNGTCVRVFETPSSRAFAHLPSKPRGNTQAVLVPAAFSGERRDYYLGVVHGEAGRAYKNYFYKMQAHPPFRIYAASRPMPIVNGQQPRNPAWTDVSFPMSLDLLQDAAQVLVGYGSGDKEARVLVMPWEDVRALFEGVGGAEEEEGEGEKGGAAAREGGKAAGGRRRRRRD
jgi:hypothetical protein